MDRMGSRTIFNGALFMKLAKRPKGGAPGQISGHVGPWGVEQGGLSAVSPTRGGGVVMKVVVVGALVEEGERVRVSEREILLFCFFFFFFFLELKLFNGVLGLL